MLNKTPNSDIWVLTGTSIDAGDANTNICGGYVDVTTTLTRMLLNSSSGTYDAGTAWIVCRR